METVTERGIKGAAFIEDLPYIKKKYGAAGLTRIEGAFFKPQYGLRIEDIKAMSVYPIEMRIGFLNALKSEFSWTDDNIFKMAQEAPKVNSAIQLFLKYLVPTETAFKSVAKYWSNYFTFGELVPVLFSSTDKKLVLGLAKFSVDPVMCTQLSGYFIGVGLLTGMKNPQVQETTCMHRGDESHQFVITWQ